MGLACSQARFLTLTARKADCEYWISINAMEKQALTRDMTNLSQEYYSKLQSKQISYYNNGKYNKINYQYLMGYGSEYMSVWNRDNYAMKDNNSMLLTDYNGQVVLSDDYARAITSVLGSSAMDKNGRGGTFSSDNIAAIMAALLPGFDAETIQSVIDENEVQSSFNANLINTSTGNDTGNTTVVDNSSSTTEKIAALVDFYYPIFLAAANNGWTTEYNKDMATNSDYVSDALITGTFQLAKLNEQGSYEEDCSLTYFIMAGFVEENTNSDAREEVTAWYNTQKEIITAKENMIDLNMSDLSTELEAIKTEMQSIQSLIDDAISSVFDWGGA